MEYLETNFWLHIKYLCTWVFVVGREGGVDTKNEKLSAPAGLHPFSVASPQLNHAAKTFKCPVKGLFSRGAWAITAVLQIHWNLGGFGPWL